MTPRWSAEELVDARREVTRRMASPPPPPPPTRYDLTARHLLAKAGGRFFGWLLGPSAPRFVRWLPAALTLPNSPERLCDGIAELADDARGGVPVAALVEVQTQPDPNMTGRMMLAGGLLWQTVKPTALPGDRYDLLAVVVNLTGSGDAARECRVAGAEWTLRPKEVNLAGVDAGRVLDDIAAGTAPAELLAVVPLMHRGGDDDIIERWKRAVIAHPDPDARRDAEYAALFATKTAHAQKWRAVVGENLAAQMDPTDWDDVPIFGDMLAVARTRAVAEGKAEGLAAGKAEGKIETLLRMLAKRFPPVPQEVTDAVRGCTDVAKLDSWLDHALDAATLEQFRQLAGV